MEVVQQLWVSLVEGGYIQPDWNTQDVDFAVDIYRTEPRAKDLGVVLVESRFGFVADLAQSEGGAVGGL